MKKNVRGQEQGIPWQQLMIYLLIAYILTAVILFLLAFLLFKMNISAQIVSVGIILTYALSCFCAGILAGKRMKQRRFMWGLIMGLAYFAILLLLSVVVNKGAVGMEDSLVTTLLLCVGGGMLGGMLS